MPTDFLTTAGWFTAAELDAVYGDWNAEKISVIKRYMEHMPRSWTSREVWMTTRLKEALDFIEKEITKERLS